MMPEKINFKRQSQILEIVFEGKKFELEAEFLRVNSPSAEVRGHGSEGGTLPVGKRDVRIKDLETAGNYALKIIFDDGHDSGLFDWNYLEDLGKNKSEYWQKYLDALEQSGKSRDGMGINIMQL